MHEAQNYIANASGSDVHAARSHAAFLTLPFSPRRNTQQCLDSSFTQYFPFQIQFLTGKGSRTDGRTDEKSCIYRVIGTEF